jgi:hypothetical protein
MEASMKTNSPLDRSVPPTKSIYRRATHALIVLATCAIATVLYLGHEILVAVVRRRAGSGGRIPA